MRLAVEVAGVDHVARRLDRRLREHHRAEHRLLGVEVLRGQGAAVERRGGVGTAARRGIGRGRHEQVVKPAAPTVATVWIVELVMARGIVFPGIIEHMFACPEANRWTKTTQDAGSSRRNPQAARRSVEKSCGQAFHSCGKPVGSLRRPPEGAELVLVEAAGGRRASRTRHGPRARLYEVSSSGAGGASSATGSGSGASSTGSRRPRRARRCLRCGGSSASGSSGASSAAARGRLVLAGSTSHRLGLGDLGAPRRGLLRRASSATASTGSSAGAAGAVPSPRRSGLRRLGGRESSSGSSGGSSPPSGTTRIRSSAFTSAKISAGTV